MFGQNGNNMNPNNTGRTNYLRNLTNTNTSLGLSLWNGNLSMRIRPAVGVDGNGVMQYDRNRATQTALTPENAAALLEKFDQKCKEQGDTLVAPISVYVPTAMNGGKSNVIGIEVKPSNDPACPDAVLHLIMGVSSEGIADAGNVTRHEFAKKTVYTNYNPTTGAREEGYENVDFEYFLNVLRMLSGTDTLRETVKSHRMEVEKSRQSGSGNQAGPMGGAGFLPQSAPTQPGGFGFGNADEIPFN